jgi:hypothetical protein
VIGGLYAHNQSVAASEYNQAAESKYNDIISSARDIEDSVDLEAISLADLDSKISNLKNIKANIDANSLTYYDSSTNLVSSANDYLNSIINEFEGALSEKIDDAVAEFAITDIDSETKESLQAKIDGLNSLTETLGSISNVDTADAIANADATIEQATAKKTEIEEAEAQATAEAQAQADAEAAATAANSNASSSGSYSSGSGSTNYTSGDTSSSGFDTSAGYEGEQRMIDGIWFTYTNGWWVNNGLLGTGNQGMSAERQAEYEAELARQKAWFEEHGTMEGYGE